jgi:hypothetical protein
MAAATRAGPACAQWTGEASGINYFMQAISPA